jgi:hypothetical protein
MKNKNTLTHRLPWLGNRITWLTVLAIAMISSVGFAQTDSDKTDADGKVWGGYQVNQAIELGGRIVDSNGSDAMYDTLVDLHSGARLLDYSLNMHSLNHNGTLMDDLSFSNTGYGGDPERHSRLRMSKSRWYDLSAQYRRNVNFYDYNAFANPYNYGPTVSTPTRPTVVNFNDSIHMFNTRRHMGDFNLTILPQSPIRFRVGYSRLQNDGPSYSSFHEGTDIQLFQDFSDRQDQYTIGADWRLAPRTNISFDETLVYGQVNTTYVNSNAGTATIGVGTPITQRPVDLGAIWNTYYGQPCANPVVTNGVLTPTNCGVYGFYHRSGPVRTVLPTSALSFTSNFFKRVDINGSVAYTNGDSRINNYMEQAQAYVTRTNELGFQFAGPTYAQRTAANADFGFTVHLNDSWSVSNQTRWVNYRQPAAFNSVEYACFPNTTTGVNLYTPVGVPFGGGSTCAGIAATGVPQHTSGSGADYDAINYLNSFNMQTAYNTTLIHWDFSKQLNVHAGYRYGRIDVTAFDFSTETAIFLPVNSGTGNTRKAPGTYFTPSPDADDAEVANDEIRETAFVFGAQLRPFTSWRINFDYDLARDNGALTPIWPQRSQKVKIRSNYKLNRWLSFGGAINLLSNRNDQVAQNPDGSNAFPVGYNNPTHKDNSNAYSLNATIEPNKYVSLDLGFTWNGLYSNSGTCLMVSSGGGNLQSLTPQGGPIQRCPNVGDPFVPGLLGAAIPSVLDYSQKTYTTYGSLQLRPVKRLTVTLGLDATADSGNNAWLRADNLAPLKFPVDAVGNVVYGGNALAGAIVGYADAPNPWQPLGTLYMKWLRPNAGVEVELHKNLTFKGGFNYWDYREKGPNGPVAGLSYSIAPRNFTAKAGTLALRYSF